MSNRIALIAVFLFTASALSSASPTMDPTIASRSPGDLDCQLTRAASGMVLSNRDSRAGKVALSIRDVERPVVFEIGRANRHYRQVCPERKGRLLTIPVNPSTDYEIHDAGSFADHVIRSVCGGDPAGTTDRQKLEALGRKLRETSDPRDEKAIFERRLLSEAYCALLSVGLKVGMEYRGESGADYRLFAGRSFRANCVVTSGGSERIENLTLGLFAPDEWDVKAVSGRTISGLDPGGSAELSFTIRAPRRSQYRGKIFPVIGELSFTHRGVPLVLHYPCRVALADPFKVQQTITRASPQELHAEVSVENAFPGLRMDKVAFYTFLEDDLEVKPRELTLNFDRKTRFSVTYRRTDTELKLRSVNLVLRADEHAVRLRTVLEVVLPLGIRTRSSGLWMNEWEDGVTESATIGDTACRRSVRTPGSTAFMYFALSDNMPITGKTYATVTYYDGPTGAFSLQYDSSAKAGPLDGAYKEVGIMVVMKGTGTWKQKTFAIEDGLFGGRQNSGSDFRLAVLEGDLAVSQIAVSKFAPADSGGG